jgi:uncharacterized protein YqeY
MGIKNDLEKDLISALKENNAVKKTVIRIALSSIKFSEIEVGKELDDQVIFGILQKEIKTREETISDAKRAGRDEMIAANEDEIGILKGYLPKELSDIELNSLIEVIIKERKASDLKDMGLVMKDVIQKTQGRASNDRISKIVREKLTEK